MGAYRGRADKGDPLYVQSNASLTEIDAQVLRLLKRPVPPALPARFVIDTGSRRSCATPALLSRLGCPSAGTIRIQAVTGPIKASLFRVRLEFPVGSLGPVTALAVAALEMPPKLAGDFQGVIGRDVLSQWEFFYSGFSGRLTIHDKPSIWSWLLG